MNLTQHVVGAAFLRGLVGVLVATASSGAASQEGAPAVLAKMAATYAGLRSYQDSGSVRYNILGTAQEVTFTTAFVRPTGFRFEWISHHPFAPLKFVKTRSILRFDGAKTYTWNKFYLKDATEQQDESLALGVAGATGVSGGSAHRIATLLIPDLWKDGAFGSSVSKLGDAKVLGTEVFDGVDCYQVSGTHRDERMDLWIGRSDYLLRKVEFQLAGKKNVELHQSIVINQEVPAALFTSADTK